MKINLFLCTVLYVSLMGCSGPNESLEITRDTRDLDRAEDFGQDIAHSPAGPPEVKKPEPTAEELLIKDGFHEDIRESGKLPKCYNYKPKFASVSNYLRVVVGSNTDVVVKLMTLKSHKCIRYVYIRSGDTYDIKGIPQGEYYTKVAYGKSWFTKTVNGKCIGKFARNALYSQGETMDFRFQYGDDGSYQIPSFEISLDVIDDGFSRAWNSRGINEDEFNY